MKIIGIQSLKREPWVNASCQAGAGIDIYASNVYASLIGRTRGIHFRNDFDGAENRAKYNWNRSVGSKAWIPFLIIGGWFLSEKSTPNRICRVSYRQWSHDRAARWTSSVADSCSSFHPLNKRRSKRGGTGRKRIVGTRDRRYRGRSSLETRAANEWNTSQVQSDCW